MAQLGIMREQRSRWQKFSKQRWETAKQNRGVHLLSLLGARFLRLGIPGLGQVAGCLLSARGLSLSRLSNCSWPKTSCGEDGRILFTPRKKSSWDGVVNPAGVCGSHKTGYNRSCSRYIVLNLRKMCVLWPEVPGPLQTVWVWVRGLKFLQGLGGQIFAQVPRMGENRVEPQGRWRSFRDMHKTSWDVVPSIKLSNMVKKKKKVILESTSQVIDTHLRNSPTTQVRDWHSFAGESLYVPGLKVSLTTGL